MQRETAWRWMQTTAQLMGQFPRDSPLDHLVGKDWRECIKVVCPEVSPITPVPLAGEVVVVVRAWLHRRWCGIPWAVAEANAWLLVEALRPQSMYNLTVNVRVLDEPTSLRLASLFENPLGYSRFGPRLHVPVSIVAELFYSVQEANRRIIDGDGLTRYKLRVLRVDGVGEFGATEVVACRKCAPTGLHDDLDAWQTYLPFRLTVDPEGNGILVAVGATLSEEVRAGFIELWEEMTRMLPKPDSAVMFQSRHGGATASVEHAKMTPWSHKGRGVLHAGDLYGTKILIHNS